MSTFTLVLLSKNYSPFAEHELPLTVLPRVGEIIEASALLGDMYHAGVTTFFVLSVTYRATKSGLQPRVTACQWYRGFRHEELAQRGWLMPHSTEMLAYDEDEFYPERQ